MKARLGAGAFGAVFRAYDPDLDRDVALKVPRPEVLDDPAVRARFLREARAAARLTHPHIVPVYDTGTEGDHPYIAAAFIEGKRLADALDGAPLDFRRAAGLVRDLADALAYAHGVGVIHRDVKPHNVMLDAAGEAHLMDFGLARLLEDAERMTREGAVLGTPAYMAPEQAKGQQGEPLPASDQYSLGIVLYELLTGRTPFEGPANIVIFNAVHTEPKTPRSLRSDVPLDLEAVCLKAISKRPEDRYADCAAFADDLRRFLVGEPTLARPPRLGERLVRWLRKDPLLAAASLAAAVGLVVAAVVSVASATRLAVSLVNERSARQAAEARRESEMAARREAEEATKHENEERRKAEAEKEETDRAIVLLTQREKEAREAAERLAKGQREREATEQDAREKKALAEAARKKLEEEQRKAAEELRAKRALPVREIALAAPSSSNVVFDSESKRVGVGVLEGLELWDATTGARHSASFHNTRVMGVAFASRSSLFATTTREGRVYLWAYEGMKPPRRRGDVSGSAVALAPDGRRLGVADDALRLLDENLQEVVKIPEGIGARSLSYHPDGRRLAVLAADGLQVWDVAAAPKVVLRVPDSTSLKTAEFSPDGRFLAGVDGKGVVLRDAATGKEIGRVDGSCFAFRKDGKLLVTGVGNTVVCWHGEKGDTLTRFSAHSMPVRSVAVSPDGSRIASLGDDRKLLLWDASWLAP